MFKFDHIKTLQKCLAAETGGFTGGTGGTGGAVNGFTGAVTKAAKTNTGGASPSPWGVVGAAANTLGGFMPLKTEYLGDKGVITAGMDSAYDSISDGLMAIPGWGTAAGGIMKLGALAGKGVNALGGGTDGMTTTDAILGSSFFNITPIGMINGFGGSKTDTMEKDYNTLATVGASYGGAYTNIDSAMNKQGKKYGLFSLGAKNDANLQIWDSGIKLNTLRSMALTQQVNLQLLNNLTDLLNLQYLQDINGTDWLLMRAAKNGDKLFSLDQRQRIYRIKQSLKLGGEVKLPYVFNMDAFKEPIESNVEAFKNGGLMNVIPEGALHKNKHHMEDDSPELDGLITKKGIPVVVEKEGGEVEQLAEIECNEIIFNKEVTTKLEEYYKKFYSEETSLEEKDDLAIKAGKLLSKEIMENTDDRTGLLNEIQ